MIWEPVATLSPTLIRISLTIPAAGAGTSMEALSPSTAIRDWSSSTLSPTATMISVTSTSSAPISGTIICLDIVLYPLTRTFIALTLARAGSGSLLPSGPCMSSYPYVALTWARPCPARRSGQGAQSSYAYSGLTLSASMPYLAMASATTCLSISPRLASSVRAATTT